MIQFLYLASARPSQMIRKIGCLRLVFAFGLSSPAPPALDMSGPKVSIETIDVSDDGKLKVDVFFVRIRYWRP